MPEDFWGEFHNATGITLSELLNYRNHPIDRVPELLKANIPIFMAAGDSDDVVPYEGRPRNPSKYMLYSDYLNDFLDYTVTLGDGKKYEEISKNLYQTAKKSRNYLSNQSAYVYANRHAFRVF